jgi:hypothetical protein
MTPNGTLRVPRTAICLQRIRNDMPRNMGVIEREPTQKMPASYDDYYSEFRIELWEDGKGFELDIHHEGDYDLDKFKRESLIPAITRHEKDNFLDKYYELFGKLKHFTKIYKVRTPD